MYPAFLGHCVLTSSPPPSRWRWRRASPPPAAMACLHADAKSHGGNKELCEVVPSISQLLGGRKCMKHHENMKIIWVSVENLFFMGFLLTQCVVAFIMKSQIETTLLRDQGWALILRLWGKETASTQLGKIHHFHHGFCYHRNGVSCKLSHPKKNWNHHKKKGLKT